MNSSETEYIDIVFDGPPRPDAGRFAEVENDRGESIALATWIKQRDGCWVLRIPMPFRGRVEKRNVSRG
jgi:hypothetical protein